MQRTDVIDAIHSILSEKLNIPRIAAFNDQARLNEDLYLDSVLLLQLLLNLEQEMNLQIPDTALNKDDFKTVSSLSDFVLEEYLRQSGESSEEIGTVDNKQQPTEEFEDIKVHCFVSCVCDLIKKSSELDHRPFYFGVWDADIIIDNQGGLNYHSDDISHQFFIDWYQQLYGVELHSWYQPNKSKAENITVLLELLENKSEDQRLMVMLDMYRLPERENKFNQNPFPHYVMLEESVDPEKLLMLDPDFRWEGELDKAQVLYAIESNAVAGGYLLSGADIKPYSLVSIRDYFLACFTGDKNPVTDIVRTVINRHTTKDGCSPALLTPALAQLPVLSIRKYAYEHALAFLGLGSTLSEDEFESWCEVIEQLVTGYKLIHYRAMKIADQYQLGQAPDQVLLKEIHDLLDQQDHREFRIKQRLWQLFEFWCEQSGVAINDSRSINTSPAAREVV